MHELVTRARLGEPQRLDHADVDAAAAVHRHARALVEHDDVVVFVKDAVVHRVQQLAIIGPLGLEDRDRVRVEGEDNRGPAD